MLARSTGLAPTHPSDTVIPTLLFDLSNGRDRICVSGFHRLTHGLAFGDLVPAHLSARDIEHLIRYGAARAFGAVEIKTALQDAVGEQVVKRRIGALDNQPWQ
ncbi:hypothetical protein ALQ22_200314 [Pseudomonas savastanoi pv. retacarpa]|nr:hypothetical protein ALQ22_200314 [Pseudomonas savastanoi pv. retacarpa]